MEMIGVLVCIFLESMFCVTFNQNRILQLRRNLSACNAMEYIYKSRYPNVNKKWIKNLFHQ